MPDARTAVEPRPSVSARRRARRRRVVVLTAAGAVVLMAAGGGVALAVAGSGQDRYRTAEVTRGTVTQTIHATGTVSSATRRDLAFSVAGTVATVPVAVGDSVTAGQTVATLDTASLQDDVDTASSKLADAQQQLEDDLASQTSSSSSTGSTTPSTGSTTPSTGSTTPSSGSDEPAGGSADPTGDRPSGTTDPAVVAAVAAVQKAQQDLLDQYEAASSALATSSASVTSAQATCAAFLAVVGDDVDPEPTPSPSPSPTSTGEPTDDPTTEPSDDPTTEPADAPTADAADAAADSADHQGATTDTSSAVEQALADCQAAVSGTLDAQQATDVQQQALLALARSLDDAVRALQKAQAAATEPTDPNGSIPTGSTTSSDPSSNASSNPSSNPTSSTPTAAATTPTGSSSADRTGADASSPASAATILADQAAIDLAEADLAVEQHKLAFVTLTSPIAGTVAAVSVTPGASVEASSSTAVVTVLGTDGHTVATTVPLTSIDIVEVGQEATVTTPTTDATLTAKVTSIGVLDQSETSEPSYAVELALDPTQETLYDGASAQVTITVAGGDEVLTVPTSAVHVDGTDATVQVLEDGTPTSVTVERGAVGAERTEILSGVALGDEVVLADTAQAIDTGSSSTSRGLSGLGGDGGEQFVVDGGFAPPAGVVPGQFTGPQGGSGGGGR